MLSAGERGSKQNYEFAEILTLTKLYPRCTLTANKSLFLSELINCFSGNDLMPLFVSAEILSLCIRVRFCGVCADIFAVRER